MKTFAAAHRLGRRASLPVAVLVFCLVSAAPGAGCALAMGETSAAAAPAQAADDATASRNYAPGYTGSADTWRDPATGDIITSVVAPRQAREQAQQPIIYVAPQIGPGWPGGASGWNDGGHPGGRPQNISRHPEAAVPSGQWGGER